MKPAPRFPDAATRDAVRATFAGAGYTEAGLAGAMGQDVLSLTRLRGNFELARRAGGHAPQALLLRLFLAGLAATREEVHDLLGTRAVEALARAGLLDGDAVWHACAGITPVGDQLIAHDRRDAHRIGAVDFVPGPGPATRRFADFAIRRPGASVLDLGCGQGALTVLAATDGGRVVAADLNPRAVAYTAFNAELNGLDNIVCVQGDLFSPVAGSRFDVILSNPPFVISPASTFLYRDGGGGICERIAREAPAHLADGGILLMPCNWPCHRGRDWRADLAGWFMGGGCDVWILQTDHFDAATYAGVWLRQEHENPADMEPEFLRWMSHYDAAGIESLGGGVVAMRRPGAEQASRTPWIEIRDLPPTLGPCGETIARVLRARDELACLADDATLLDSRLALAPEARCFVTQRPGASGWARECGELRLTRGLAMGVRLDPFGTALAGFLDGTTTPREAVAALADQTGAPADSLRAGAPELLRRLVELGLVVVPQTA